MAAGVSGAMTVLVQAARSIVLVDGGWPRLCQPSTLRMVIWPEASSAQNSIAAVSAEGRTVWVLILRLPQSQWKSARTTNAIERLHEEFKRRIKTQTVLPSAETAAMLFWALLASGQITMRKVDGWQTLAEKPAAAVPLDLAA